MTFLPPLALLAALTTAETVVGGAPGAADPRVTLVELQRGGDDRRALVEVDRLRSAEPAAARDFGLALLRGHLLERLGRRPEAAAAFAAAIGETPDLAPWARLRLAANQLATGHPEVAAGVASAILVRGAPEAIAPDAATILQTALRQGGDCRLLGGIPERGQPRALARTLALSRAECDFAGGRPEAARLRLETILDDALDDLAAFDAAELWLARLPLPDDRARLRTLGAALAEQRDFERAVPVLERSLVGGAPADGSTDATTLYRLARSQFWLGRYERAIATFEAVRGSSRSVALRADSRYQQARCRELAGDRAAARALFVAAYDDDPTGEWAGPALLGVLRLDSFAGRALDAGAALDRLSAPRALASAAARGALFLASTELVQGRSREEVRHWLDRVERSELSSPEEVAYWRGRAAEIEGRSDEAVRAYVDAGRLRPFHPLARAARGRLASPALARFAAAAGEVAARGRTAADSRAAWLLLGPTSPAALAARARGLGSYPASADVTHWVRWQPVAAADWPLFATGTTRPEERLLALGLFREGLPVLARVFPVREKRLAFTAADFLVRQEIAGPAIAIAETIDRRRPVGLADDWISPDLRRLLYPLPYRTAILAQAGMRRVDPWLLAAILREESRFRPEAVSAVGARGLAQLTLPTARRLAARIGIRPPAVADLHRPEVAIPLAAAYLGELEARFDGSIPAVLAAYNAGEAQAELWRSYCRSGEPEEYLAKIGFRETRAYVFRVLESRAQYADLYGL